MIYSFFFLSLQPKAASLGGKDIINQIINIAYETIEILVDSHHADSGSKASHGRR
jgi:hypothetical protein